MKAGEIREMEPRVLSETGLLLAQFEVLRELTAQVAELNAKLSVFGDVMATSSGGLVVSVENR